MPPKRKNPFTLASSSPPTKKATLSPSRSPSIFNGTIERKGNDEVQEERSSRPEEEYEIVQREFYPPEMSNARSEQYNNNEIPRPMEVLSETIDSTAPARNKIKVQGAVVHWFKRDLRTTDNRALHLASEKARNANVPLICLFIVSPQDYQAHLTSSIRVDFELRTLAVLKQDLAEKNIPLYIETVPVRKTVPARIVQLCESWSASHLFCNIEYEVDELRRETKMINLCLSYNIDFTAVHDDAIVPPGVLATTTGHYFSVYSPFHRAWLSHLHTNPELLSTFPPPRPNPPSTRNNFPSLFTTTLPSAPPNKSLTPEETLRFSRLWPPGEHEAQARLQKFLNQRITAYASERNFPAENSTSCLSVHLAAGTLSARTAVAAARAKSGNRRLDDDSNEGTKTWIAELAWRDFYKSVLCGWPYICMSKPFLLPTTSLPWSYNPVFFAAWCSGQTGYPLIDAAMRQLNNTGYMHNRPRMLVSSFLSKHLLLDWRLGERYFMLHLIDGDFASNNGGWGFGASVGVDALIRRDGSSLRSAGATMRFFNPVTQSRKFDPQGEFIRKWVPELRGVKGDAVHDPWGAGREVEEVVGRTGYPRPIVVHAEARKRAVEVYGGR